MAVFQTNTDYFRFFANESRKGGSPLYEALSLKIAEDEAIQKLAAKRRRGQPAANLIFGAVHYLLLGGANGPLRDYYPSLGGTKPADGNVYDHFRSFCLANEAELVSIIAERVTNTNEVGRSALLAPAFELVHTEAGAPLGLVELGPSAGFNLNFDRYGYRYTDDSGTPRLERRLNSALVLTCLLKGAGTPDLRVDAPPVSSRLGLELSPIDIGRESEQRWLKALVWPERLDRFARLDGALKVAAEHPLRIIGCDAIGNLAASVAGIPRDQARCVYHTIMAYQLSREQYAKIDATLLDASKAAPIWRVSIEGEISGPNPSETITPLKIHRYRNGERQTRSFGICDPHGLWLEWTAR